MQEQAAGLGRAIQVRRAELGLKRKEVAERALLSYPYLSELENGAKTPSAKALRQLAEALELSPAELLARAEAGPASPEHRLAPPGHVPATVPLSQAAAAAARPDRGQPYGVVRPRGTAAAPADGEPFGRLADMVAATVRAELAAWARTELPTLIRDEVRRALDEESAEYR